MYWQHSSAPAIAASFQVGYYDLKSRIRYPEDAMWDTCYTNKAAASSIAGAKLWASLLEIYEYMEVIRHSFQHEWRIVKQTPLYGYKDTTSEVIKNISPPTGWDKFERVLSLPPCDIAGFVCPEYDKEKLLSILPVEYKDHDIETYNGQ